jgi:hypothetical protein
MCASFSSRLPGNVKHEILMVKRVSFCSSLLTGGCPGSQSPRDSDPVPTLALVRGLGEPLWREASAHHRPAHRRCRLCPLCTTGIGGSYWTTFFPAAVVLGIGMAVSVAPLTTAVMGAVDAGRAGSASGVNNAVARAAGLLAIAVQGLVVLTVFSSSLDRYLARLSLPSEARNMLIVQQSKLVGIALPAGLSHVAHAAIQQAIAESFVTGFRVVMLIAAGLALANAPSRVVVDRGHVTHKRCNAVVNDFPAPLARFGDGLRDLRDTG